MKKLLITTGALALMASVASADTYVESVVGSIGDVLPNTLQSGAEVGNTAAEEFGPVGAIFGAVLGLVGGAVEGGMNTVATVLGADT